MRDLIVSWGYPAGQSNVGNFPPDLIAEWGYYWWEEVFGATDFRETTSALSAIETTAYTRGEERTAGTRAVEVG